MFANMRPPCPRLAWQASAIDETPSQVGAIPVPTICQHVAASQQVVRPNLIHYNDTYGTPQRNTDLSGADSTWTTSSAAWSENEPPAEVLVERHRRFDGRVYRFWAEDCATLGGIRVYASDGSLNGGSLHADLSDSDVQTMYSQWCSATARSGGDCEDHDRDLRVFLAVLLDHACFEISDAGLRLRLPAPQVARVPPQPVSTTKWWLTDQLLIPPPGRETPAGPSVYGSVDTPQASYHCSAHGSAPRSNTPSGSTQGNIQRSSIGPTLRSPYSAPPRSARGSTRCASAGATPRSVAAARKSPMQVAEIPTPMRSSSRPGSARAGGGTTQRPSSVGSRCARCTRPPSARSAVSRRKDGPTNIILAY